MSDEPAADSSDGTERGFAVPTATDNVDGDGPFYASLEDFVTNYLAPAICRKNTRTGWCPQWWAHPEAVLRLWALWQAWEQFRTEGGAGMSSWWVYHADHHLATLFDREAGPFAYCRDGHSTDGAPLPCQPAPAGLGPLVAQAQERPASAPGGATP